MQAIIGKDFPKVVIPKINDAKKSIKIVVFDWRWYPNDIGNPVQLFNQSIVRAIRRNVEVKVIANSQDIVNTLNSLGAKAKKMITKNLVHAKMLIIDDSIVIVGSHNYTQSAFTMNYEISALYNGVESAKQFSDFFASLYAL